MNKKTDKLGINVQLSKEKIKSMHNSLKQENGCAHCNTPMDLDSGSDLCENCSDKLKRIQDNLGIHFRGIEKVKEGYEVIFQGLAEELGLDLNDPNFTDTPNRIARSMFEVFEGVKDTDKQLKAALSTDFPTGGQDSMIIAKGIKCYSMCPHHILPVRYNIHVAYIPSKHGRVLGASKIPRVVEILARRPVLQEQLTEDIAKAIETVKPIGVAVFITGIHMCMTMRGIEKEVEFITSKVTGKFKQSNMVRDEFFNSLKVAGF